MAQGRLQKQAGFNGSYKLSAYFLYKKLRSCPHKIKTAIVDAEAQ